MGQCARQYDESRPMVRPLGNVRSIQYSVVLANGGLGGEHRTEYRYRVASSLGPGVPYARGVIVNRPAGPWSRPHRGPLLRDNFSRLILRTESICKESRAPRPPRSTDIAAFC